MKKSRSIYVLILGCIVFAVAWKFIFRPDVDRDASHLGAAISAQSWGDVYDQATSLEKGQEPWTRDQFIKLMDRITASEPKQLGMARINGNWRGQTSNKAFTFQFPNLPMPADPRRPAMLGATFFREGNRWAPMLVHIVTQMNSFAGGSLSERDERLIDAMQAAGIDSLTDYAFHIQLKLDNLKQVHEGKVPRSKMFTPIPVS